MNDNFLGLVEYPRKTKTPLMLDNVPASTDPDAGPFLLTSSKGLLWVERAFDPGFLRLGVRKIPLGELFLEMVSSVAEMGEQRKWENVHPPTAKGFLAGMAHLSYYGLSSPTLVYGSAFDIGFTDGVSRAPADWLPPDWGVLLPNREYVGTAYLFPDQNVGAVVHNPSRGVVVLRPSD